MSSEKSTLHKSSQDRSDRAEFVSEEIIRYYTRERRTARFMLGWCAVAMAGGIILFQMGDAFCCGIATPLLFFLVPALVLILPVINCKFPPPEQLLDRPSEMEEERQLQSVVVVQRKRIITIATWILTASVLAIICCAVTHTSGWIMGIAVGTLVQTGVCLSVLLVSTFRSEMYLHALFSYDTEEH